ncbi:MAG: hypothetical protein AB7K37_12275 [Cyclobacteriaceae bacterium]
MKTEGSQNEITVFSQAITDADIQLNVDLEEADIFELFDSDILDSIPGLKEIRAFYKAYASIRDRLFMKKFLLFLQELRTGTISEEKRADFKAKFDSDKKYRTRIMEHIISYIDEYKSNERVKILSRLFRAYIEGHYDWEYFLAMAGCLERVNLDFVNEIPRLDTTEGKEVTQYDERQILAESNLISSGLAIKMSVWSSDTYPTQLGKDIYKFGLA